MAAKSLCALRAAPPLTVPLQQLVSRSLLLIGRYYRLGVPHAEALIADNTISLR